MVSPRALRCLHRTRAEVLSSRGELLTSTIVSRSLNGIYSKCWELMKWPIMLTTHAWCNPNQILPHYPQNGEVTQQALLPATPQEPKHTGRPPGGPRALQLILAIGFYAEKNKIK